MVPGDVLEADSALAGACEGQKRICRQVGKKAPVIVLPGDAGAREQSQKPASDLERCDDQSGCRFFAGEARIESARLKDPLVLCAWL